MTRRRRRRRRRSPCSRWGGAIETRWSKDGESLPYQEELLLISNVTSEDEGSYSCLVTSPLDSATQDWEVAVVDPAFITHFTDYRLFLVRPTLP